MLWQLGVEYWLGPDMGLSYKWYMLSYKWYMLKVISLALTKIKLI